MSEQAPNEAGNEVGSITVALPRRARISRDASGHDSHDPLPDLRQQTMPARIGP
jgi:hypothetical protein